VATEVENLPSMSYAELYHLEWFKRILGMGARLRTLFLVRHAETAWNQENRYQGQTDIPLNESGRESARRLRVRLQRRPQLFDPKTTAIVSSDLLRAKESAELAFSADNREIHLDPDLRELRYGIFEGCSRDEVAKKFSEQYKRFSEDPDFAVEGGEARSALQARAVQAIRRWLERLPHRNLVIVTHGGVLRQLMQFALGDGEMPTHVRFSNLSVHLVSVEPSEWTYAGSL
jgi:broad specificity phosphatase PhoE